MRQNRENAPPCEILVAKYLHSKGLSYIPQAPFILCPENEKNIFIFVDFYLPALRLVIEVDGDSHNSEGAKEKDRRRDLLLRNMGIMVSRITNSDARNGVFDGLKLDHAQGLAEENIERMKLCRQLLSEPYSDIDEWRIKSAIKIEKPKSKWELRRERYIKEMNEFIDKWKVMYCITAQASCPCNYVTIWCYNIIQLPPDSYCPERVFEDKGELPPTENLAEAAASCIVGALHKIPSGASVAVCINNTRWRVSDINTELSTARQYCEKENITMKIITKQDMQQYYISSENDAVTNMINSIANKKRQELREKGILPPKEAKH